MSKSGLIILTMSILLHLCFSRDLMKPVLFQPEREIYKQHIRLQFELKRDFAPSQKPVPFSSRDYFLDPRRERLLMVDDYSPEPNKPPISTPPPNGTGG